MNSSYPGNLLSGPCVSLPEPHGWLYPVYAPTTQHTAFAPVHILRAAPLQEPQSEEGDTFVVYEEDLDVRKQAGLREATLQTAVKDFMQESEECSSEANVLRKSKEDSDEPLDDPIDHSAAINEIRNFEKPNFVYSEQAERKKKIADVLHARVPDFVERNADIGWYSLKNSTFAFRVQDCTASTAVDSLTYISLRVPWGAQVFPFLYGKWNAGLMRKLQDKFNFGLRHIKWLQRIVLQNKLPLNRALSFHDLMPLLNEVEESVLVELVGHTFEAPAVSKASVSFSTKDYKFVGPKGLIGVFRQPNFKVIDYTDLNIVRTDKPMIFEYDNRRDPRPGEVVDNASVQSTDTQRSELYKTKLVYHYDDRGDLQNIEAKVQPTQDQLANIAKLKELAQEGNRLRWDAESSSPSRNTNPPTADMPMMSLIREIIGKAKECNNPNPVMRLLLDVPDAEQIMFYLATQQPAELQQLVSIMKDSTLTPTPEILTMLRHKFEGILENVVQQREGSSERKRRSLNSPHEPNEGKVSRHDAKKGISFTVAGNSGERLSLITQKKLPEFDEPSSDEDEEAASRQSDLSPTLQPVLDRAKVPLQEREVRGERLHGREQREERLQRFKREREQDDSERRKQRRICEVMKRVEEQREKIIDAQAVTATTSAPPPSMVVPPLMTSAGGVFPFAPVTPVAPVPLMADMMALSSMVHMTQMMGVMSGMMNMIPSPPIMMPQIAPRLRFVPPPAVTPALNPPGVIRPVPSAIVFPPRLSEEQGKMNNDNANSTPRRFTN